VTWATPPALKNRHAYFAPFVSDIGGRLPRFA
jgi:hypothetical protein